MKLLLNFFITIRLEDSNDDCNLSSAYNEAEWKITAPQLQLETKERPRPPIRFDREIITAGSGN